MLYFLVMPQREPSDLIQYLERHAICCDLTCDSVSRLVTFNHMLDHVSTQLVSFHLLDLSNYNHTTQYNQFQSLSGSIESDSLFIISLNYYVSDVLIFTFHVEDGEICSQSHSGEYYQLGPDPMQNTQGRRYPYITGSFNYSSTFTV